VLRAELRQLLRDFLQLLQYLLHSVLRPLQLLLREAQPAGPDAGPSGRAGLQEVL
jgi:hypothetical protein